MKRLYYIFAIVSCVVITGTTLFAGESRPEYQCAKAVNPPVIDGNLVEWKGIVPISCSRAAQKHLPLFTDEEDLKVVAYIMWDDANLYFALDVDDDNFTQKYEGAQVWQGDSIQCIFDMDNKADKFDYEYEIAMTPKGPSVFIGRGGYGAVDAAKIVIEKKKANNGFIYEMALPWKGLKDYKPGDGKVFGFTFLVNDNDGRGREGWIEWTPGIGTGKAPGKFGRLRLVEKFSAVAQAPVVGDITLGGEHYEQGQEPIAGSVYLQASRALSSCRVVYRIEHNKTSVFEEINKTDLAKGMSVLNFSFATSELPLGVSTFQVIAITSEGKEYLVAESEIMLINQKQMEADITAVEQQCAVLSGLIANGEDRALNMAYPKIALAVNKRFIAYNRQDLKEKRYQKVNKVTELMTASVKRGIREAKHLLAHPETNLPVVDHDMSRIVIRDGSFYVGNNPVMLVGPMGWFNPKEFAGIGKLNFGIIETESGPSRLLKTAGGKVDRGSISHHINELKKSLDANIAYDHLFSMHYFPGWAYEKYPDINSERSDARRVNSHPPGNNFMPTLVGHPEARNIQAKYLRELVPAIKDMPALNAYCMANEPIYMDYNDYSPRSLTEFRAWLKGQYENISALNKTWAANYKTFDAVKPPPQSIVNIPSKEKVNQAVWYDWLTFNNHRVTEYFKWLKSVIREMDPDTPVRVEVPGFGGDRNGVLGEAIAELCEISGMDAGMSYPNAKYAMGFLGASMKYDFYRSIAPGNPVVNSEDHYSYGKWLPEEYFAAHLWESVLHGMDASMIWVWNRKLEKYRSMLQEPQRLEAFSRTALDLLRLSKQIHAFQRNKADVAILWSEPSRKARSGYDSQLAKVYEGLFFLDTPFNFISEKQVAGDGLARYKLLLVNAGYVKEASFQKISQFVNDGGQLILIGDAPLKYDEHGLERKSLSELGQTPNINRMQFSVPEVYADAFEKELKRLNIAGVVRVLDSKGNNLRSVETRTVNLDGELVSYIINYNKKPVDVYLSMSSGEITECVDLISQKTYGKSFELDPLVPLVLAIKVNRVK